MWLQSESGNLINLNAVTEIVIIGPYDVGEFMPDGTPAHSLYDLYALNVGEPVTIRGKAFRDAHRYLVQHSSYDLYREVLEDLARAIESGSLFFNARRRQEEIWKRKNLGHRRSKQSTLN